MNFGEIETPKTVSGLRRGIHTVTLTKVEYVAKEGSTPRICFTFSTKDQGLFTKSLFLKESYEDLVSMLKTDKEAAIRKNSYISLSEMKVIFVESGLLSDEAMKKISYNSYQNLASELDKVRVARKDVTFQICLDNRLNERDGKYYTDFSKKPYIQKMGENKLWLPDAPATPEPASQPKAESKSDDDLPF